MRVIPQVKDRSNTLDGLETVISFEPTMKRDILLYRFLLISRKIESEKFTYSIYIFFYSFEIRFNLIRSNTRQHSQAVWRDY